MMLLFAGLQGLGEGAQGLALALAVFEILTSLLLAGSVVVALRRVRRPADHASVPHLHHGGVDWVDVCTAGVLLAEVAEHWHVTHHLKRPTILLAVVLLVIGVFHGRIKR